jgi:hypothetical protein
LIAEAIKAGFSLVSPKVEVASSPSPQLKTWGRSNGDFFLVGGRGGRRRRGRRGREGRIGKKWGRRRGKMDDEKKRREEKEEDVGRLWRRRAGVCVYLTTRLGAYPIKPIPLSLGDVTSPLHLETPFNTLDIIYNQSLFRPSGGLAVHGRASRE